MKLFNEWLACADTRTLSEYVADRRAYARQARQQRHTAPQFMAYLAQMQNSPPPLWMLQGMQQHPSRQFGSGIGSLLGGLFGGAL